MKHLALTCCLILSCGLVLATEPVDLEVITQIRTEAFERSKVMDLVTEMTEKFGARLTGSPSMTASNEWTKEKLTEFGLKNAELHPFPFGRGWSFSKAYIRVAEPQAFIITAYPEAWTVGTSGKIRGQVVRADLDSEEDLEAQAGKLKGKIVLLKDERELEDEEKPNFRRYDREQLQSMEKVNIPSGQTSTWRSRVKKRWEFSKKRLEFLKKEKVAGILKPSGWDHGIVRLGRGANPDDDLTGTASLVLGVEHYNRLARLVDTEDEVIVELDVDVQFHDAPNAFNTIAEIPGSDLADEVVMLGAHLDSWHAGTGATDNAAGCAVMMEAVRLLQKIGVKPRRTIRIALWSGEEQGLIGSRAYVEDFFASRPETEDEEQLKLPKRYRDTTWPLQLKQAHEKFSIYFNLDNGGGKIRGVYAENNAAAKPIFEQWLKPFEDIGAETVTLRGTGGTDHVAFNAVGLPGFQFIQDRLEYFTRTHHTQLDTLEHLRRDDLVQASIIVASFVYHASMRDELMPRKPLPRAPDTDE